MSRKGDKFGDAIMACIDIAEQNDVPYDEIIAILESWVENMKEGKAEYEARMAHKHPDLIQDDEEE